MVSSKKILTWGNEDILSSSIEIFLTAKPEWEVVRISGKDKLNALLLSVETLNPDIVIIHQESRKQATNLPMQLLHNHPDMKVIVISLEDNLMDIYSNRKKLLKQAADLVLLIENEP